MQKLCCDHRRNPFHLSIFMIDSARINFCRILETINKNLAAEVVQVFASIVLPH